MIQEAINNIIKHANATWVEIQIISHDEFLIIEISDNGIGFNVLEQIQKVGSSGLKNMNARAQVLGGTFKIESGIGGTSLFITIPIEKLNIEN
jgi:two-component system sensor histidine kinase NreB